MHIEISKNTSFCWRHKLLASLRIPDITINKSPIVVCEIQLPYSNKGKSEKLPIKRPKTHSVLMTDARGIPCLQLIQKNNKVNEIVNLLSSNIHPEALIACEKTNLLTRAQHKIDRKEIQHQASKQLIVTQAKKMVSEVKNWMQRFNGVATKYLQQYWNWFRIEININSLAKFEMECFGQRQLQYYRQLVAL